MNTLNLKGKEVIFEKIEDYKRTKRRKIGKKRRMILYCDIKLGSAVKRKRFSDVTGKEIRPIETTSAVKEITPADQDNCWLVKTRGSLYKILITT